jgi:hypothetical protein
MTLPIRLGVPVRHRGYRYLWVSQGGPSVRLHAWRVSDPERPLTLYDYAVRPQPATSLQFNFVPGQESERLFILSEDKVVGSLFWDDEQTASADRPAFYLWVFGEDGQRLGAQPFEPVESESGTPTQQATVGDVIYRLEIAHYIVLDIAYRPGLWILWLGGALLVLAGPSFLVPARQTWIKVTQEQESVSIQAREERQGLISSHNKRHDTLSQLADVLQAQTTLEHDPSHDQTWSPEPDPAHRKSS